MSLLWRVVLVNAAVLATGVIGALIMVAGMVEQRFDDAALWPLLLVLGLAALVSGALASMWLFRVREGQMLDDWMSERAHAETARLAYFATLAELPGDGASELPLGLLKLEYFRRYQLDMQIAYYDPRPASDVDYPLHPTGVELARESDFLFLCAAGGPGQRHLVDAEMLAALGPEGVFVNISRGWLVDEEALVDAVVRGTIGGAGLDVFDDEPNVPAALREADNVVLLPHIASNTIETRHDMDQCVIDNIRSWFTTGKAITPVP
jgi:hypothetical protein